MKRFYFLAVFLWSIYFAVFPVLLDAAVSKSKAESNAHYATYYNDGAKLAQTILTQISNSIGENVFIDSINRIASEMQNMGGLKSLQSEAFKQVFIDEVKNLTNELVLSLDEETLQTISSSSIYKMLSDLMNNPKLQDYFKSISSKNTGGISIGKDVWQGSLGGTTSPAAGAGSVTYNTSSNGGLLIADIITGLASFFGSVIASLGTGALADLGLLIEDLITDIAGDLGSAAGGVAGAEVADYAEAFVPDIIDSVHGLPTIGGATLFGAGSGFLLGTISALVGRALSSPVQYIIFLPIEILLSIVDGVLMAIAGGILGLVAGVIGFLITHVVELIYDLVPGIEYNSTFWTVGGAGIVAIVATILGGIAGLLLTPFSAFPYIPVLGNLISTAVIGTLLGATSGMIIGFGVGIIALSGA
jgi:hypothetical protein